VDIPAPVKTTILFACAISIFNVSYITCSPLS
jgi:hypothetical protein